MVNMKLIESFKTLGYIIRACFVTPFGPVTIHLHDKSVYPRCYYDYKRNVWTCPKRDIFFTRDKVFYWHRPEKVFSYNDTEYDDDD